MELGKDMYEYLMYFVDDETTINMLFVNKRFYREELFERCVRRKYPLLIEFKGEKEDWKHFYLSMYYYIAYLKKKYDIPYIPTKGYNPKDLYGTSKPYAQHNAMVEAIKGGHLEIVKHLENLGGIYDSYGCLVQAKLCGHHHIAQYFRKYINFSGAGPIG